MLLSIYLKLKRTSKFKISLHLKRCLISSQLILILLLIDFGNCFGKEWLKTKCRTLYGHQWFFFQKTAFLQIQQWSLMHCLILGPMIPASSKQYSGIAAFLLAALKCFCRIKECSHSDQTSDFADFAKLLEMYTGISFGTFSLEFLPHKQIWSMEVKNLYSPSEQESLSTISLGACYKTNVRSLCVDITLDQNLPLKCAIMQQ